MVDTRLSVVKRDIAIGKDKSAWEVEISVKACPLRRTNPTPSGSQAPSGHSGHSGGLTGGVGIKLGKMDSSSCQRFARAAGESWIRSLTSAFRYRALWSANQAR